MLVAPRRIVEVDWLEPSRRAAAESVSRTRRRRWCRHARSSPQARGPAASFYTGAWTPPSKPRLPLVLCRGAKGKRDGGTRSRRRPSFGCYRQSTAKWFAVGCPLALTVTSKAACK